MLSGSIRNLERTAREVVPSLAQYLASKALIEQLRLTASPVVDYLRIAQYLLIALAVVGFLYAIYRFVWRHLKPLPMPEVHEEGPSIDDVPVEMNPVRVFERPEYAVLGQTRYDQNWIDFNTEAGVAACGWQRPKPRPQALGRAAGTKHQASAGRSGRA